MPRIIAIPGLCCKAEHLNPLLTRLDGSLGGRITVQVIDKDLCFKNSTRAYLDSIKKQSNFSDGDIVLGFSLGGQFANLLAAEGLVKNLILISPAMPSEWLQINPTRLKVFSRQLMTNEPFVWTREMAAQLILQGVPKKDFEHLASSFHAEEATLIREYAWRGRDTWLGKEGFQKIQAACRGIMITGRHDIIANAKQQTELASKLGFEQLVLESGHSPHLDINADRVSAYITTWIDSLRRPIGLLAVS